MLVTCHHFWGSRSFARRAVAGHAKTNFSTRFHITTYKFSDVHSVVGPLPPPKILIKEISIPRRCILNLVFTFLGTESVGPGTVTEMHRSSDSTRGGEVTFPFGRSHLAGHERMLQGATDA